MKQINKKQKSREEISKILKSGDFTIAYHDNQDAWLYKGKLEYDDLPENGGIPLDGYTDGYIPVEVDLLVQALGGKTETI